MCEDVNSPNTRIQTYTERRAVLQSLRAISRRVLGRTAAAQSAADAHQTMQTISFKRSDRAVHAQGGPHFGACAGQ